MNFKRVFLRQENNKISELHMANRKDLRPMKVYVMQINSELLSQVKQCVMVMSVAERQEIALIRNHKLREQMLVSKVMKRYLLSLYYNWEILPEEWCFETSIHNKPKLTDEFQKLMLNFNVSHCEGAFVMAVAQGFDVGIDIEPYTFFIDDYLASTVFSENELIELWNYSPSHKQEYLLRLWTLKEAYTKYLGLGINLDFKSVNFFHYTNEYFPILANMEVPAVVIHHSKVMLSKANYSLSIATKRGNLFSAKPQIHHFNQLNINQLLFAEY